MLIQFDNILEYLYFSILNIYNLFYMSNEKPNNDDEGK
jgi:hypothetical protein